MYKAVKSLILFNLLMLVLIAIGFCYSTTITGFMVVMWACFWGMKLSWIAFAIWFFWPYIKRGIAYLVNHRED